MAFTLTSRSISLHDTILSAECRTRDGKWKISYLDLNQYLSNRNGSFKLHGTNYFHTAESVSLDGHTLRASLRRIDGEYGEALLDLTLCVDNVDGTLRFKKPSEHLLSSCSGFALKGSVLEALCLGIDGKMHSSSIDLNECYSNDDGEFFAGATNFLRTSRKLALRVTDDGLLLSGELRTRAAEWKEAETNLSLRIANQGGLGKLVFIDDDVWTDEEHSLTRFFELVPCVDYAIENVYAKRDEEDARRILEYCASSPAVAVSFILSASSGGPVAVSICAGLTHHISILSDTPVDDPELRLQFEQAVIGRYLYSTFKTLLSAGAAAAIANTVSSLSHEEFEIACGKVAAALAQRLSISTSSLAGLKTYLFMMKVAESLVRGDIRHEWKASMKKVRTLLGSGAAKSRPATQTTSIPPPVVVPSPTPTSSSKISPPPPYAPGSVGLERNASEKSTSSSKAKPDSRSTSRSDSSSSTSSPAFTSWRARHDGLSAPSNTTTTISPLVMSPGARIQATPPENTAQQQMTEKHTTSLVFGGAMSEGGQAHSSYSSYS